MEDNAETVERIQGEAVDIANAIDKLIQGRNTAAVFTAFGMLIGDAAAQAAHPDLPALLKIVKRVARSEFADKRRKIEAEAAKAREGAALQ